MKFKKFLFVSLVAASAMSAVAESRTATACPPIQVTPETERIHSASEIVFGRVLEVDALETVVHRGQSVTLYALDVHVGDVVDGQALEDSLLTVYVLARTRLDERETEVGALASTATESTATTGTTSASTSNVLGSIEPSSLPAAPEVMQHYAFFAQPFDHDGSDAPPRELVLARNEAIYMQTIDSAQADEIRADVERVRTYGPW